MIANSSQVNLRYMKDVETYLEQDIRMDMDEFNKMDKTIFEDYIKVGKKGRFNFDTFKILKTMKNEIFDNMLSRYDLTTEQQKRNAIFEGEPTSDTCWLVCRRLFESAAFYGGTCLRIFHGLQRFSEDMDFSLLTQMISSILRNTFLLSLMLLQW